jgi:hypothetical protein
MVAENSHDWSLLDLIPKKKVSEKVTTNPLVGTHVAEHANTAGAGGW